MGVWAKCMWTQNNCPHCPHCPHADFFFSVMIFLVRILVWVNHICYICIAFRNITNAGRNEKYEVT